jgi:pre-60S factor REI1
VDFYDFSTSYPQLEEGEEVDIDADLSALTQSLTLADDDMSLVLPSGAIVGHRSLKRYYDQKLKPEEVRIRMRLFCYCIYLVIIIFRQEILS